MVLCMDGMSIRRRGTKLGSRLPTGWEKWKLTSPGLHRCKQSNKAQRTATRYKEIAEDCEAVGQARTVNRHEAEEWMQKCEMSSFPVCPSAQEESGLQLGDWKDLR
jgi:hypothetical protein